MKDTVDKSAKKTSQCRKENIWKLVVPRKKLGKVPRKPKRRIGGGEKKREV